MKRLDAFWRALCRVGLGLLPISIAWILLGAMLSPFQTPPRQGLGLAHGLLLSVGGWTLAYALTIPLWHKARRAAVAVVVAATAVAAFTAGGTMHFAPEFYSLPNYAEVSFMLAESSDVAVANSIVFAEVGAGLWALGAVMWALMAAIWLGALARAPENLPRPAVGAVGLVVAADLAYLVVAPNPPPWLVIPDANAAYAMARVPRYLGRFQQAGLRTPDRCEVPSTDRPPGAPNVLVVLHESLRRANLGAFGYERDTTPWLSGLAAEHPDGVVLFDQALSNASNTNVSVPSLLSGLSPLRSGEAFHHAPLLWHHAEAAGYRTFLVTAQSYAFQGLDDYVLTPPPGEVWTAEYGDYPNVNGGGVDDAVWAREVMLPLVRRHAEAGEPFVGVVQFNATHYPILPIDGGPFGITARRDRYDSAIHLLDAVMADLFEVLADTGRLHDTVVLVTSDHGDNFGEHAIHRTVSYYDEVLGIPMWAWAPPSWRATHPDGASSLRANADRRVSNLDLVPTVIDLVGGTRGDCPSLDGDSLLRPVGDRVIVASNTNDLRAWVNPGIGLVRGSEKYIWTAWGGPEFYDLAADPAERHDRWEQVSDRPGLWVHTWMEDRPLLLARCCGERMP